MLKVQLKFAARDPSEVEQIVNQPGL